MVNREVARRDGFSEEEIDRIDAYCIQRQEAGEFDNTAVPVISNGQVVLVCATVAEAIRLVRGQR